MPSLFRNSLVAVSLALGIAIALAVALRKPQSVNARPEPSTAKSAQQELPAGGTHANGGEKALPRASGEPAPVEAPYRDPIARQVGRLEETIQEMEEASHR